MTHNHQLAISYAAMGIKIFPCHESGNNLKAPYIKGGFHNATNSIHQVNEWWKRWPNALVGMPCQLNNIIVIDADRHGNIDGVANLHKIFDIHGLNKDSYPCVVTPTDYGEHYIFQRPLSYERMISLGPSIDIKDNGYVIAAGSLCSNGKQYNLKGGSIEDLAKYISSNGLLPLPNSLIKSAENANHKILALSDCDPYIISALENEEKILGDTWLGKRNEQLNKSAFNLGSLCRSKNVAKEVAQNYLRRASIKNGLIIDGNESEFLITFNSGFDSGFKISRETQGYEQENGKVKINVPPLENVLNNTKNTHGSRAILRPLSEIKTEHIEWLWPSRIAVGKLTMLAGDPGLGKSQFTAYLAAKVTTGGGWANKEGTASYGSVIILSCEDDAADTIKPRILAAGADVTKVHILEAVQDHNGKTRTFSLKNDLIMLGEAIANIPDTKLIIIDPVSAYLPEIDSHKTTDVRGVLAPLQEFAQKHRIAVFVVSHLNKSGGNGKAVNAVTGSGAFVAACRATFLVSADLDNPHLRYLSQIKNNLANVDTLSFQICNRLVEGNIDAPFVSFNEGIVKFTANQLLGNKDVNEDSSASLEVEEFLREELKHGEVTAIAIKNRAQDIGISLATLRRVSKKIGVISTKCGFQGQWMWSLPYPWPFDKNFKGAQ